MRKYEHGVKLLTYLSYIISWLAGTDLFWCRPSIFITVVLCSVAGCSDDKKANPEGVVIHPIGDMSSCKEQ